MPVSQRAYPRRRPRRGRAGGEEDAEEDSTHEVATLLRERAAVRADRSTFEYPAKGGIHRVVTLRDPALASMVRSLLRSRSRSDRPLACREGHDWREVHADERFKELVGKDYTAKDLERHGSRGG